MEWHGSPDVVEVELDRLAVVPLVRRPGPEDVLTGGHLLQGELVAGGGLASGEVDPHQAEGRVGPAAQLFQPVIGLLFVHGFLRRSLLSYTTRRLCSNRSKFSLWISA